MKVKKILIWGIINYRPHPALMPKEMSIEGLMPTISALFPGINYYSMSGFFQVRKECVVPALKKIFPELVGIDFNSVPLEETVEIQPFLPSNGYEWEDSKEWQRKFQSLLAA